VGQDEGGSLTRKGPPRDERPAGSNRGHPAQDIRWDRAQSIIQTVGGRWDITILRHMASGITRPADLLAAVNERPEGPRLSGKVMYEVLRRLQDTELVSRAEKSRWPKEVHYSLTAHGHETLTAVSKLGARNPWEIPVDTEIPEIDLTKPSIARVYDYWLGGKDNFAADRAVAQQMSEVSPHIAEGVRANRAFLRRAVRYLAAEAGIGQFLDIGTGLPSPSNTHEIAQAVNPATHVVYTDNDRCKSGCTHACWPDRTACLRRTPDWERSERPRAFRRAQGGQRRDTLSGHSQLARVIISMSGSEFEQRRRHSDGPDQYVRRLREDDDSARQARRGRRPDPRGRASRG
jgi:DNA-binding HxlR family transcriptional regulator